MPSKGDFINITGYYSTLLHELTHYTGHSSRLKRNIYGGKHTTQLMPARSWSLKSRVCSSHAPIKSHRIEEVFNNHASHVDGWLECIKNDNNAISQAAADANRAADYILTKAGIKHVD